jgi:uncharacterized RDD family membrane protein YckC
VGARDESFEATEHRVPREPPACDGEVRGRGTVGGTEPPHTVRTEPRRTVPGAFHERVELVPHWCSLGQELVYRCRIDLRGPVHLDDRLTIATPEGVTIDLVLAGLGSRFVARLLDTLIQIAAILALNLLIFFVAGSDWNGIAIAVSVVGSFLLLFAYDIPFETMAGGATPGKRAFGLRVVQRDASPVDFVTSSVRNLIRIIDFLPVFYVVGSITMVATSPPQRLGDLAAGTVVLRERFGGRKADTQPVAPVTVPLGHVMSWDVSAVDAEELSVVRQFLDRRLTLPWHIRTYFANELVQRLWPKVSGVPNEVHPEYVLEGIVVAKQSRA